MRLHQLVYVSSATVAFSQEELEALAQGAAERNRRRELTGQLLHHEGCFLQALEGPEPAVRATFKRIEDDPRHRGLQVLLDNPVESREFGHWDLSLVVPGALGQDVQESLQPLVTPGIGLQDSLLAAGRAHRLMRTFVHAAR